ncbi:hypothetical protein HK097_005746, partial [Rhizophlyctis rosea]
MISHHDYESDEKCEPKRFSRGFDYRWGRYGRDPRRVRHPRDGSVGVFLGHEVLKTLIRCGFGRGG